MKQMTRLITGYRGRRKKKSTKPNQINENKSENETGNGSIGRITERRIDYEMQAFGWICE